MVRNYFNGRFLIAMILAVSATNAIAQEVSWGTDIQTAWKKAQTTNRPLLVIVTSSSCPHCRKMESKTLAAPAVAR